MPLHIVVAFSTKDFGIGIRGELPWKIKQDLAHFAKITTGGIVIMGRKTFESIPDERRPLCNRLNVVVTSDPMAQSIAEPNVIYVTQDELDIFIKERERNTDLYIVGGASLYAKFMGKASVIHATLIDKKFIGCDVFFPTDEFHKYTIQEYSQSYSSTEENCDFRFVTYLKTQTLSTHPEKVYVDLLNDILIQGKVREDRTGTGIVGVFARSLRFDISKHVPFLTTKMLAWKSVIKELLFFLRGDTDTCVLEKQGVTIWKGNTTREFLNQRGLSEYREGDMGPMYGWVWRHYGAEYQGCDASYAGQGYNQLEELVRGLREDPTSRRHLITSFCPPLVAKSVLMPCHGIAVQFYVEEENGVKYLSCLCMQRSADTFLGLPFNIASYAVLTHILAKMCGMIPREIVMNTGDTHIYSNHLNQVHQQLERSPLPFPVLEVSDGVKEKTFDELVVEDFTVVGYIHHPAIRAPMAV